MGNKWSSLVSISHGGLMSSGITEISGLFPVWTHRAMMHQAIFLASTGQKISFENNGEFDTVSHIY